MTKEKLPNKIINSVRFIGTILEWFIFGILILTFLIVLSPLLPTKNYIYTYIVSTGSMEPVIKTGSVALVKPIKPEQVNKGDIVTFTSPQDSKKTIIHRIFEVNKKNKTFVTKGDNNNAPDNWTLSSTLIKGKFVTSIPYLGHPAALLKTKKGFFLMVLIPALLLALFQIKKIKEGIDQEVEKRTKKALERNKVKLILTILLIIGSFAFGSIKIINATLASTATASHITFSVKDFVPPPAPTLISPANDSYRNTSGMIMYWSTVTDYLDMHNPVYYIYQSSHVPSFSPLAYQSGHLSASQIPAPGTPDGIYYWRVKACDSLDNCSAWSEVWKITVDNTPPSIPGQIGWTTENPPVGSDYTGGSDLDNYKTCGGAVNYSPMTNLWAPSTDVNSIIYEREVYNPISNRIYSNTGLANNYENGGGAVNGTTYWVRIRAKDIAGNYSNWTVKCAITYDTSAPTTVSLTVEGSFIKSVEEKITNGNFETGDLNGWTTAGDVTTTGIESISQPSPLTPLSITPNEGNSMARIGNYSYSDDEGNMVWENRLMRSFEGGAKSISLYYNFVSRDDAFDDPGFFIRLNGQEIFKLSSSSLPSGDPNEARSSDWQQFYYDLSTYNSGSNVNLALYSGNMNDNYRQSWTYIDKVTTYFVSAPAHAVYTLTGSDSGGSGINHFEYSIDGSPFISGDTFGNTDSLSVGGTHIVQYLSIDNAGNNSSVSTVKIITDDKKPSPISDLSITSKTTNSITLSWNAPYNDYDNPSSEKASLYDVRYSLNPIDEANFNSATKVDNVPSPKEHNFLPISDPDYNSYQELLTITGLSPNTNYYFAIKSSDQAPNTSDISNVIHDATYSLTPPSTVSAGDIVINEIMWMGTAASPSDQYIELHNTTNQLIALSGFRINKLDGGSLVNTGIGLTNITIPTKGYLVITKFDPASSESHLINTLSSSTNVLIDSNVNLLDLSDPLNPRMQIELEGPAGEIVDVAWESMTALTEGLNEGGKYYSMERTSIPGDGTKPLNWYTCIDEASKSDFFDNVADERGTPGAENRSENEPPPLTEPSTEPSPKLSPEPSIEPSIEPPSITPTETPILESSPTPEITSVPENTPIPEADPTVSDSPTPTP